MFLRRRQARPTAIVPHQPPPRAVGLPQPPPPRAVGLPQPPPPRAVSLPQPPPPSSVAPHQPPASSVIPYQPQPSELVVYESGSKALVQVPINQASFQLLAGFGAGSGGGAAGGGFRNVTKSWWFTVLVMGIIYCWMDDNEAPLTQVTNKVAEHQRGLKWADRAYAYVPSAVVGAALSAGQSLGLLNIDKSAQAVIDELSNLMPPLDSALSGFKTGINPGPFRYAFEGSDCKPILRYALFLVFAQENDWNDLLQTVAPIKSGPDIVRQIKAEFERLSRYPAAGWMAGTALGFTLPLNMPIVTLVMAYNLVGATLAYSKGIDDLDRELRTAMPHLHTALNQRIEQVIERRVPGAASRLRSP